MTKKSNWLTSQVRGHRLLAPTVLALLALTGTSSGRAGPLTLSQTPPGASAREPAPNIIVSVDDSGSMGSSGMTTLKAALTATFSATNIPDGRVRLAWHSMNTCRQLPSNSGACGNGNGMQSLEGTHRTNFLNWARSSLPATPPGTNLTPSHDMMQRAGEYLRTTGTDSPWRNTPGNSADTTELTCRKSFNIFMTDGAWNTLNQSPFPDGSAITVGGGNADGIAKTLPDGTVYSTTNPQTALYRDTWGNPGLSTLSDVAFHYWATDLQPAIANEVRPTIRQTGTETVGSTTLDQYWNPKNNPAKWQHMVTYSIGFKPSAINWTGDPVWSNDMFGGAGYTSLVNGSVSWVSPMCPGNVGCNPTTQWLSRDAFRPSELWHMALNSRGRFIPAPTATALVDGFKTILDDILSITTQSLTSIAASTSRLRANGVAFVAGFDSDKWSGQLGAFSINPDTAAVASSPTWNATTLLDTTTFSVSSRVVLTHNGSNGTGFQWARLSTAQQNAIKGADTTTVGQQRLGYLRGDRTQEISSGGIFRNRASRLGDIVNSSIWFVGRPERGAFEYPDHSAFRNDNAGRTGMLFVGANDGMLHGFNATTGAELVAYVPAGVYANLRDLSTASYIHRFFVDGQPFTGDANVTGTASGWRTILVSGLGAGGKGYFALDVTNPANFVDPGATPSGVVLLDNTTSVDADVGHMFSPPALDSLTGTRSEQIVKLNNNRWAIVMGNGYNSANERPVLLIQYLDGARELLKIVANATTGQSNGLSTARLIDINGDGKMDVAYAGDLKGNLWKFNLSAASSASWSVGFSGVPLYVAKDGGNNLQPITTAPTWMANPVGGIQLAFGTGQNLTDSDRTNTGTQTLYSIYDSSTYAVSVTGVITVTDSSAITGGRTSLVMQTQTSTITADGNEFFNTSENPVVYTGAGAKRGWYLDLAFSKERVLSNPQPFSGQKVIFFSQAPAAGASGETCDLSSIAPDNFITVLNMFSGQPAQTPVFAVTDATVNMNNATRTRFGSGDNISLRDANKNRLILISPSNTDSGGGNCPSGTLCTEEKKLNLGAGPGARADWREVR